MELHVRARSWPPLIRQSHQPSCARYFGERGAHPRRVSPDPDATRVTLAVSMKLCGSSVKCIVLVAISAHVTRKFVLHVKLKIVIIRAVHRSRIHAARGDMKNRA